MPILQAVCEYKNVSGLSIQADVFLPREKRPPVLLYIHGGALISGTRKYVPRSQVSLFRQAGFAVAAIDYRLAPETHLPAIISDIEDAVRWAKGEGADRLGFDPERVGVIGSSAGGYLSLMAGTLAVKPRAIVSLYGYGDILGDWYSLPNPFYRQVMPLISKEEALACVGGREKSHGGRKRFRFYFYTRQQGIWAKSVSGWDPTAEREKLLPYCPEYNIGPEYPPALLLHGDADTDVPCEQSTQMAAALTRQGIPNRLIVLPGAPHGFDGDRKNPAVKKALQAVVDFLRDQL